MKIPFVDLKAQYRGLKKEIDKAIESVIEETAFIRGKFVESFEEDFRQRLNVNHCISVANGTDAIYIALRALGIGQGDEVITTAMSWISTSEVIAQTGAQVVFVDIEPDYYTIDVTKIEEKITPNTKAIIPVHLYGQPADLDELKNIAERYNLKLIEDCAQAHFATYKGKNVGTYGTMGTFSFYPSKNLGAYGDAGAIVTDDDEIAIKARMYANHGALRKHEHKIEGVNSRMDGLQGSILLAKLSYIEEWNRKRHQNAICYNRKLSENENITMPKTRKNAFHVFHLYVIRTQKRDELRDFLASHGIATGVHYPTALPFLEAYGYLGHTPKDFPIAHQYQNEILSLPMYPELSEASISYVAEKIGEFAK